MLHGDQVSLRARQDSDVQVLQSELYDDVATRCRADTRPWRPVPPDSDAAPYAVRPPSDEAALFSVVRRSGNDLAGEALLYGIDAHNRSAHLGLALRPGFRGQGLGRDTVAVLCRYGFDVLGLHSLQLETLVDNAPMIAVAVALGFREEGRLREAVWVDGRFADQVIFRRLTDDRLRRPDPAR